ncbi:MAG: hypothetical protein VB934_13575 [Polyangiaceae bacterium]
MVPLISRHVLWLFALAWPLAAQATTKPTATKWVLEATYAKGGCELNDQSAQLRALQRRYGSAGLRVRVLLPEHAIAAHRATEPPYEIATAKYTWAEARLELLIDGAVEWSSETVDGVEDVVRLLAAHDPDRTRFYQLRGLRNQVTFFVCDGPAVPETASRLVEVAPTWGLAHAWRYRDDLWNRADRVAARRHAKEALRALAGHPHSLTVFCDYALRTDRYETETARAIAVAMKKLVDADERAILPWLTWVRAQLRVDAASVTPERLAAKLPVLVKSPRQLELAEILASAPDPKRFRDLSDHLLGVAWKYGVELDRFRLTTCLVARACRDSVPASNSQLDQWLTQFGKGEDLNSLAWALLTKDETLGRFDLAARLLVERLRKESGGKLGDAPLDTLALALYGTGEPAEALRLETQCIANGDGDPRYDVRRRRYEQAVKTQRTR